MLTVLKQAIFTLAVLCIFTASLVETTKLVEQIAYRSIAPAADSDQTVVDYAVYSRTDAVDASLGF